MRRSETAATTLAKELFRALEKTPTHGGVFFAARAGEIFQFLPLLGIQTGGDFNDDTSEQITAVSSVHTGNSFAAKLEDLSALRSGRNFHLRLALQSRHGQLSAEGGDRKRNGHFTIKIVFIALKNLVLFDVNDDVKVALGSATNSSFAVLR